MRNSGTILLEKWEEAVGVLRDFELDSGKLMFEDFTALVPSDLLHEIDDLSSMKGHLIGILRTETRLKTSLINKENE